MAIFSENRELDINKVVGLIFLIESVILHFAEINRATGKILSISLILLLCYNIIKAYKCNQTGLFLILLFMVSYCVEPAVYFINGEQIGYAAHVENNRTVYQVALMQLYFYSSFTFFVKNDNKAITENLLIQHRESSFKWLICIAFALICIFLGKSGKTIFEAGGYGNALEEMNLSTAFGYGVIPLIIAYIYSYDKKRRNLTILLSGIYIIRDLSYGGRVDSIILVLALFFMHYQYIIGKGKVLILAIVGFILSAVFEIYRTLASGNFIQYGGDVFSSLGLTTGNSSEVYYASMRIFYLIDNNVLGFFDRIEAAIWFFLSVVIPTKYMPPIANLSSYLSSEYWTGGGGLCSTYVFCMFGLIGVLFLGYWIAKASNEIYFKKNSENKVFYSICVLATTPRWYAYYPLFLIKYCIIALIVFMLIKKIYVKRPI